MAAPTPPAAPVAPPRSHLEWTRRVASGWCPDTTAPRRGDAIVTPAELAAHDKVEDAWLAIRGQVYDVTAYLSLHPGGVKQLLRGAGRDATTLFDAVHKWVTVEAILAPCRVGRLVATATGEPGSRSRGEGRASDGGLEHAVPAWPSWRSRGTAMHAAAAVGEWEGVDVHVSMVGGGGDGGLSPGGLLQLTTVGGDSAGPVLPPPAAGVGCVVVMVAAADAMTSGGGKTDSAGGLTAVRAAFAVGVETPYVHADDSVAQGWWYVTSLCPTPVHVAATSVGVAHTTMSRGAGATKAIGVAMSPCAPWVGHTAMNAWCATAPGVGGHRSEGGGSAVVVEGGDPPMWPDAVRVLQALLQVVNSAAKAGVVDVGVARSTPTGSEWSAGVAAWLYRAAQAAGDIMAAMPHPLRASHAVSPTLAPLLPSLPPHLACSVAAGGLAFHESRKVAAWPCHATPCTAAILVCCGAAGVAAALPMLHRHAAVTGWSVPTHDDGHRGGVDAAAAVGMHNSHSDSDSDDGDGAGSGTGTGGAGVVPVAGALPFTSHVLVFHPGAPATACSGSREEGITHHAWHPLSVLARLGGNTATGSRACPGLTVTHVSGPLSVAALSTAIPATRPGTMVARGSGTIAPGEAVVICVCGGDVRAWDTVDAWTRARCYLASNTVWLAGCGGV